MCALVTGVQTCALPISVSTLDLLSGGRLRLSIGVGHAEHEFEVLGVPYAQRGQVADEPLAAMIELWTNDRPSFHGKHVRFDDIASEPKPVQQPHPGSEEHTSELQSLIRNTHAVICLIKKHTQVITINNIP